MKDHKSFFKDLEDHVIDSRYYESEQSFEVEALYQAFKARFMAELVESSNAELCVVNLPTPADQHKE